MVAQRPRITYTYLYVVHVELARAFIVQRNSADGICLCFERGYEETLKPSLPYTAML